MQYFTNPHFKKFFFENATLKNDLSLKTKVTKNKNQVDFKFRIW